MSRLPALRFFAVLACAAALSGCAAYNIEWLPAAPSFPGKFPEQVQVFYSKEQVPHEWSAIGLLTSEKTAMNDSDTRKRQADRIRQIAAEKGADAVIIRKLPEIINENDPEAVARPRRVYLSGVAIRYIRKTQGEQKGDIEYWRKTNQGW